ncbi:MAG: hypothetical protein NVV72_14940 [Asticcacaulis sp.]|nr:hypothetical protein [Asticcacaulis sp.]
MRLAGGMGALAPVMAQADDIPAGPETEDVITILLGLKSGLATAGINGADVWTPPAS